MRVIKLMYVLYKIKLLSPITVLQLIQSIYKHGLNLMALLSFAAKKYGDKVALVDDDETVSYKRLLDDSSKLAVALHQNVQLQSDMKVAFICKNHSSLVKSIFASSRLGAELLFLNTQISKSQFVAIIESQQLDMIIYDEEYMALIEETKFQGIKLLTYHHTLPAINNFLQSPNIDENDRIPRTSSSKLTLFTSGTTGVPKKAVHKPTLFHYLNPFLSFITRLKMLNYGTGYIATPIYHGYGIAILLLFIPLGKKVIIRRTFIAKEACNVICEHQVEMVTLVPTMLQRMLEHNKNQLTSLNCIVSGGAKLSSKLVKETFHSLGPVLYNLYGTSEVGLNFIATPEDLAYSHTTIGKKICGMDVKVLDRDMNEVEVGKVGQLCIQNDWSMRNKKNQWIETGDLGYRDANGYYFLCGRTDEMIISGGINTYPIEVENILVNHPLILDVAVIGIDDDEFGQRLKAFVLPLKDTTISEKEVLEWLRLRVPKFQLPKEIELVTQLPYTQLGKLDRKQLYARSSEY
nr:AMP-binding protein [Lysinibacillus timonensis]